MASQPQRRPSQGRKLAGVWVFLGLCSAVPVGAEGLDPEAWITVRTASFTVRSNAEPERAVEIARSLERFRAAFSQLAEEHDCVLIVDAIQQLGAIPVDLSGLRIDFLLASAVAGSPREVEIDREFRKKQDGLIPSDHAPVWADLEK